MHEPVRYHITALLGVCHLHNDNTHEPERQGAACRDPTTAHLIVSFSTETDVYDSLEGERGGQRIHMLLQLPTLDL